MTKRSYFSVRTGKNETSQGFSIAVMRRLFHDIYIKFSEDGFFQEYFGYECIDAGQVPGKLGMNIEAQIFRFLRKENLWPIEEHYKTYIDHDVFDLIEFLYDHVSKPIPQDGEYHSYGDCGWHYSTFNDFIGREEFKNEMNDVLTDFEGGYELSIEGEIFPLPDTGLDNLLDAEIVSDDENVKSRIESAISKFRSRHSNIDDRRDALRDLADVLEYLRPKIKDVLSSEDESDLFNLANNFGIRHHNKKQKTEYDKKIWYSWIFYHYLATIHAVLRLQHTQESGK